MPLNDRHSGALLWMARAAVFTLIVLCICVRVHVCISFLTDKRGDSSCHKHTDHCKWFVFGLCMYVGRCTVCLYNPLTPYLCLWGVYCVLPPILFCRSVFLPLLEHRTRSHYHWYPHTITHIYGHTHKCCFSILFFSFFFFENQAHLLGPICSDTNFMSQWYICWESWI